MLEANPDLSPAEVKEILKLTAERRGEASAPEVDPFWNRDFGFGMVDAYAAVSMAMDFKEKGLTGIIDVTTQVHVIDSNTSDGVATISGLAWGQTGAISAVEYRIDNGQWMSATFDEDAVTLGAFARFNWTIALDTGSLEDGNRTIEIRALNSEGVQSLPVSVTVFGASSGSLDEAGFGGKELVMIALATALIILAMFMLFTGDDEDFQETQPLDAVDLLAENEAKDAILVNADDSKGTEESS
jgi:hypothetical protein